MEISAEPGGQPGSPWDWQQQREGLKVQESKSLIGLVQKETWGMGCKNAGGTSSLCLEGGGKWSGWVKIGVWSRGEDGGKVGS